MDKIDWYKRSRKKKKRIVLNEKHKLFCKLFTNTLNATQSYLEVYKCDYNTAMSNGHRLLRNAEIKKEIEKLKKEKNKAILLESDDILEKMMRIAFSDIKSFIEWGNKNSRNYIKFLDSKNVDGGLITEVKQGKEGVSIKLSDKQKALDWLSKYFLMNPLDKHKIWYDKSIIEHRKYNDNEKLKLEKERIEIQKDEVSSEDRPILIDTVEERLNRLKNE